MFGSSFDASRSESKRHRDERGFAMIVMSMMLLFILIPAAGLAIDVGLMYLVQSRLSGAVDAAALAGARALSRGSDDPTQKANGEAMANAYFNANFPPGYFFSTNAHVSSHGATDSQFIRSITTTASVDLPLLFMRILRMSSSHISASAKATRRDANVMLVLDRSGSLANSHSCGSMKTAASSFVEKFTEQRDYVGMVSFGTGSHVDDALSQTFKSSVEGHIAQISCVGATNSSQALWDAYRELVTLGQGGALNVILFFTDGRPTAVTEDFPIKGSSTCDHKSIPKLGVLTFGGSAPYGLFNPAAPLPPVSGSRDLAVINESSCYFYDDYSRVTNDVSNAPKTDHWQNSLTATNYRSTRTSGTGLDITSASNIEAFSTNAADHAAYRIRHGDTITGVGSLPNVVIFTIGYGNDVDDVLLKRIANDPSAPASNVTTGQPGLYVYAPTMADLDQAFTRVASEILRLAQ